MSDLVHVSLREGQAEVLIGNRELRVDRRDKDDRTSTCPVELVSAALGS